MLDILYLLVITVFFYSCAGLLVLCQSLMEE
jgi:hypothetical protein